jgi:hypothetical protein
LQQALGRLHRKRPSLCSQKDGNLKAPRQHLEVELGKTKIVGADLCEEAAAPTKDVFPKLLLVEQLEVFAENLREICSWQKFRENRGNLP